jgi:hypothetical protein
MSNRSPPSAWEGGNFMEKLFIKLINDKQNKVEKIRRRKKREKTTKEPKCGSSVRRRKILKLTFSRVARGQER